MGKELPKTPEAIGKGIASYISAIKADAPEPAKKELVESSSRREALTTKSAKISISQKAMHRKKRKQRPPNKKL